MERESAKAAGAGGGGVTSTTPPTTQKNFIKCLKNSRTFVIIIVESEVIKMLQIRRKKEIFWGSGPLKITFHILAHFNEVSKVHIFAKTRSALAKILKEFRRARRSIGTSSTAHLAGLYETGSLRWLACHSGRIIDGDKIIKFKNPNTRKIIHYLEH